MSFARLVAGWAWRRLLETEFVRAVRRFTRPLICVFAAQFLAAYSYFIMSAVLVQYLSANLGMTDVQASLLYTAFGILISVSGMVFGLMIDQLSLFVSLLFGAGVALTGKVLFLLVVPAAASDPAWTIGWSTVLLVTLLPLGETAMGQAVGLGIKRYVRTADGPAAPRIRGASRSIEYGFSYILQNVAALLAYVSISVARVALGGADELLVNRVAIGLSFPALVLAMGVALLGMRWDTYDIDLAVARREDALLADDNLHEEDLERGELACWERWRPRWMSRLFVTGDTGALFVRYLVVSLALTGSKSLFRHLEATMPKYTQRAFAPAYDYTLLLQINPALVIVLTAVVQSWLTRLDTLPVIIGGTALCSLGALLFMVPLPFGSYLAVVLFTLGEIVWSPRFVDYVYQLAPEGQEGAFGSIASAPLFLAKIPVGLMSGYLLDAYCPAYGTCNGPALWGAIAGFSFVSPLVLLAVYRWVTSYVPGAHGDHMARLVEQIASDTENVATPRTLSLSLGRASGRGETRLDNGSPRHSRSASAVSSSSSPLRLGKSNT